MTCWLSGERSLPIGLLVVCAGKFSKSRLLVKLIIDLSKNWKSRFLFLARLLYTKTGSKYFYRFGCWPGLCNVGQYYVKLCRLHVLSG